MLLTAGLLRSFNFLSTSDKVFMASTFTSTSLMKTSKAMESDNIIIIFPIFSLSLSLSLKNKHNTIVYWLEILN